MNSHVERDEDDEVYPFLPNQPIAPALDEPDDDGWRKDETWVMGAETSGIAGDYAVGPIYQAHYSKTVGGETFVVEENYYVQPMKMENEDGTFTKHYDVTGMYVFTLCTDPEDPGGSEIWSDVDYDTDLHVMLLWKYEDARALAERCARQDQRGALTWHGGIPQ